MSKFDRLIDLLPLEIFQDDIRPTPLMRDWTAQLPLRYQGVLVTAIRGCDGAQKNDASKGLTRQIRRAILNPADKRETTYARGFFGFLASNLKKELPEFFGSLDQYPLHYILHLMHASEIIGYLSPNLVVRNFFAAIYLEFVRCLHLNPETKEQLRARLTLDRVAAGTVEQ